MNLLVRVLQPTGPVDVWIEHSPSSTVGDVLAALGLDNGSIDGRRLDPAARISDSGIYHGALLADRPMPDTELVIGQHRWELCVVSGPQSGLTVPLPANGATVGRSRDAGVTIRDDSLSRTHLHVRPKGDSVSVTDLDSVNGTFHNGARVTRDQVVQLGDYVQAGSNILAVRCRELEPLPLERNGYTTIVDRAPRLPRGMDAIALAPPPMPSPSTPPAPLSALALAAPVVVAVAISWISRNPIYLLFALTAPLVPLLSSSAERRRTRRADHNAKEGFREAAARFATDLEAQRVVAERGSRDELPDLCEAVAVVIGRGRRLWERGRGDEDFLVLRAGAADQPLALTAAGQAVIGRLVPVAVDLREIGVLGIVGSEPAIRRGVARSLIGQVVAFHAPSEVRIAVVTDNEEWAWMQLLPHVVLHRRRPETDGSAVLEELSALVEQRAAGSTEVVAALPAVVVVVDDVSSWRKSPSFDDCVARGPDVGVHVVCLAGSETELPTRARGVLTLSSGGARVGWHLDGRCVVDAAVSDGLAVGLADTMARSSASLRPRLGRLGHDRVPPTDVRLKDMLVATDAASIAEHWRSALGHARTEVLLGQSADGPLTIDLASDGPHALVAGTTGAGKSELLRTMVLSLAVQNAPDAMQLLLVDYKGGLAFGPLARLPHIAGHVTDLDEGLAARAIQSLRAELQRRERMMADATTSLRLPRLVIVIDEFRTLVADLPDFLHQLIDVAARGRSLGMHLIAATQRPESVTEEIRANTNLRVCLAVASAAESQAILEQPDAATITTATPGRGYLRRGGSRLTLFQTALADTPPDRPDRVTVIDVGNLSVLSSQPNRGGSDLVDLCDAIVEAGALVGTGPAHRPWTEPLPDLLDLATVLDRTSQSVVVGLSDVPSEQVQAPFAIDLARTNLLVAGGPRSGKSTALRTIAAALVTVRSPDRLHLYAIDGTTVLRDLDGLPHFGGVVSLADEHRLMRLLSWLRSEIARRQDDFADSDPEVVTLLDGYSIFHSTYFDRDGGRLVEQLHGLLRDGPAVGVTFVVTSDRAGLYGPMTSACPQRLILDFPDTDVYAQLGLAGIRRGRQNPGRGLWVDGGIEIQLGVAGGRPGQADEVAWMLAATAGHDRPKDLPRIDPLPRRVTAELASTFPPGAARGAHDVLLGIGGDALIQVRVDLDAGGRCFVIGGALGSGKSSTIASLLHGSEAHLPRRAIVLVTPRRWPELRPPNGVTVAINDADAVAAIDAILLESNALIAVDDAELVLEGPVATALERAVRAARDGTATVLLAGTTDLLLAAYRGWTVEARRSRHGVLLAPSAVAEGELLGVNLPRSVSSWSTHAGRGLYARGGAMQPLQVVLPPSDVG